MTSVNKTDGWDTANPVSETKLEQGAAASPGIAIGRAYVVDRRKFKIPKRHVQPQECRLEEKRLRAAIEESHEQLERVKGKLVEREGEEHFQILEAHQLIMEDEHLVDATVHFIHEEQINAEWALSKTAQQIKKVFDSIEDDYFRERRSDIDFVADRIMRNLMGVDMRPVKPPPDAIVVAHDLAPSDTAHLQQAAVAALVTDAGSRTSHTAIIARAHQIPAVVGLEKITQLVGNDDLLVVDGTRGLVVLHPTPETVAYYRGLARHEAAVEEALLANRDLPAETLDGCRLKLMCNLDESDEVSYALDHGAEGVGLFRTEFFFLRHGDPPDEQEHYDHAVSVVRAMKGRVTTFRTFDLGGDKGSPLHDTVGNEANPALGLRSMRLCLAPVGRELFKAQLRGLLRAATQGPVRIMFPMISGLQELRRAKEVFAESKQELTDAGVPFNAETPVGIMIEMPSAALTADLLAKEVDFFSIGTNDLIQYLLAIDRVNEHVSYLYRPTHPALLRLVKQITDSAKAANIPVSICGELAGEARLSLLLLGLGITEMSMDSSTIPVVKSVIRASTQKEAEHLALEALQLATADEVDDLVYGYMSSRFSSDIIGVAP